MKVCSEPGCPTLVRERKCKAHTKTRQQRGYGSAHDRLRAEYQARMDASETFRCWRCGEMIDPRHWHLGHADDDRTRYRGPEHVACNTATNGR